VWVGAHACMRAECSTRTQQDREAPAAARLSQPNCWITGEPLPRRPLLGWTPLGRSAGCAPLTRARLLRTGTTTLVAGGAATGCQCEVLIRCDDLPAAPATGVTGHRPARARRGCAHWPQVWGRSRGPTGLEDGTGVGLGWGWGTAFLNVSGYCGTPLRLHGGTWVGLSVRGVATPAHRAVCWRPARPAPGTGWHSRPHAAHLAFWPPPSRGLNGFVSSLLFPARRVSSRPFPKPSPAPRALRGLGISG
jgi:hypothetical protein